jgi:FkbM family methyltransferase
MIKKLSYIFYKIIFYIDKIFYFLTSKSILVWIKDFIQIDSYKSLKILNIDVKFFIPTQLTNWRVDTFFSKEPETLEWIDNFNDLDELIFWDIGANIGLYSIYNSLKNPNSKTISFEPSTSNLRVLSRNISINNLEKNILIVPIPLTNKENEFLMMKEGQFIEGGALNSFGEEWNFEGKKFASSMNYQLIGTTINFLLDNNILEIPDYIKIDVDGIEHLILEGANKYLSNKKIKSISIEINENFTEQYEKVLNVMKKNDFIFLHKKHNEELFDKNSKLSKTFNYVFVR